MHFPSTSSLGLICSILIFHCYAEQLVVIKADVNIIEYRNSKDKDHRVACMVCNSTQQAKASCSSLDLWTNEFVKTPFHALYIHFQSWTNLFYFNFSLLC